MQENIYNIPKFLSNSILRSVDLNALNQNIKSASFLAYEEYNEGIISGLKTQVIDDKIIMSKGIYKFKDEAHFVDEKLSIELPKEEGEYILTLKCDYSSEEYVVKKVYYLKYGFDKEGIEIARFHIRNGANLINEDYKLKKFEKEYNSINTLDVNYSKTGINPEILKMWANQMLEKNIVLYDTLIAYFCKLEMINKEILKDYIYKKLDVKLENSTNKEIVKYLYEIFENASSDISLNSLEESIKNISLER